MKKLKYPNTVLFEDEIETRCKTIITYIHNSIKSYTKEVFDKNVTFIIKHNIRQMFQRYVDKAEEDENSSGIEVKDFTEILTGKEEIKAFRKKRGDFN